MGAAGLSAGAALASILSYTSAAGVTIPGGLVYSAVPTPHGITLAPSIDTAESIGDSIQLAAVVTDSSGTVMVGVAPVWTSGEPSVATVSQAGRVTARSAGSTAIVVRVGGLETRSRIVVHQKPATLEVDDTLVTVLESERAPLRGHVADARGNPIVGADVTWSAPDPAVAVVEGADVVGVSPGRTVLTALSGQLQLPLPVEVIPVPGSITLLGGEGQRGPAGRALPAPVTAQVVSRTGRPMPGVTATFHSVSPGASAEPAVDTSDARGMVRTIWRLGDVPGRQQLTIAVDRVSVAPALGAEADPVPANTRVEVITGIQKGEVGDTLREPVAVRALDSLGMPLGDLPVSWSALDGGVLTALSARTDSLGEARATWRLGARAGRQRARVQVGNSRTMPAFTAVALAGPAPAVAVIVRSGDRQLGSVGAALKAPIVLRTVDRHRNAVPGVAIRLEPAAGRLPDSSVTTDSAGQARIQWTLGRPAGLQRMLVRLPGDTSETEVAALARPGKPAKVAFVSPPQTARSGRTLPKPIVVQVTDAYGNPLGGQTVVFTPSSGSVSPARGLTDADGRAEVRWTIGPKSKKPELVGAVAGAAVKGKLTLTARP
jgi:hypothetical protein